MLGSSAPADLHPQLRRDPALQPVAEARRGDVLAAVGVARSWGGRFPLGGLRGDLWEVARLHLAYGLGERALFEIKGTAWQVLDVTSRRAGPGTIELEPGVDDGVTADAGDFELALSFLPLGRADGLSAGMQVSVKLPNTDERKGIGLNTTDVTLAALVSLGRDRWRGTGALGIGILEAPLDRFEQNDVIAYAFEGLYRMGPRLRLAAGLRGRASTRSRVPRGTEDLGEARLAAELRAGATALDLGVARGFARNGPGWRVQAGVAWTLARHRAADHRGAHGEGRHRRRHGSERR